MQSNAGITDILKKRTQLNPLGVLSLLSRINTVIVFIQLE